MYVHLLTLFQKFLLVLLNNKNPICKLLPIENDLAKLPVTNDENRLKSLIPIAFLIVKKKSSSDAHV